MKLQAPGSGTALSRRYEKFGEDEHMVAQTGDGQARRKWRGGPGGAKALTRLAILDRPARYLIEEGQSASLCARCGPTGRLLPR